MQDEVDEIDVIEVGSIVGDPGDLPEKKQGDAKAKADAKFLCVIHSCKVNINARPMDNCLLKNL